jgi:hypothetical protein
MLIGYARTSTLEQEAGLEAQLRDLKALGCEKVFREQTSSVGPRPVLNQALEFVREGDAPRGHETRSFGTVRRSPGADHRTAHGQGRLPSHPQHGRGYRDTDREADAERPRIGRTV